MNTFQSLFAERLTSYVELRRQLGLRFKGQEVMLHAFDRYLHELEYHGPLTEQLAKDFALSVNDTTTTVPARRYLVVRHFAEYLATYDPATPRLDPKAMYRRIHQPLPYIFSEQEIEQLMDQATAGPQRYQISNESLCIMIGLAASTGLRRGELLGLDRADVNLDSGILVIRHAKLNKDRLIPVHSTTLEVLRAYANERHRIPGADAEEAFFLNSKLCRYQAYNLDYQMRRVVQAIDLQSPHRKRPTFHSLRHTFAVRRLVSWYQAGENVQALLPALATYMGHVHYTSTAYYLTATAELLGVSADRLFGENNND